MASFHTDGLDALELSFQEIAELPEETIQKMLLEGGDIIKKGQTAEVQSLGLVDSGILQKSISMEPKFRGKNRRVVVNPKGVHHITTAGKKIYNNDVGFIHEFGAPHRHIPAKQWMRVANEKHINAAVDAEAEVYDDFLKSKGL